MNKSTINFVAILLGFGALLFGIHYYILSQFFEGSLMIPLWVIYAFNAVMVFLMVSIIKYQAKNNSKNLLNFFLILTVVKMVLILVLLLPLFFKKPPHLQLEVMNFFIPYFFFLTFEIFSLNKFLQKT